MSNIDPTKPGTGNAFTADVRKNFAIAKAELEVLQNFMNQRGTFDSPIFTGTAQFDNVNVGINLTVAGLFTPTAESYIATLTPALSFVPASVITAVAADGLLGGLKFNKDATGTITITGAVTVTFATAGGAIGRIVAPGLVTSPFFNPSRSIMLPLIELSGYPAFIFIKTDGSVWLGLGAGITAPGLPYATTVFFSGSYRIVP